MFQTSRREFLRDLGLSAAALPFVLNLPSLGFANQTARKQRLVVIFSPNGVVPKSFWPDEEGCDFKLKESLLPLEPFQSRMLTLHGVCDKVRGDGDSHMRGIGCLLTGVELSPETFRVVRIRRRGGRVDCRSTRKSKTFSRRMQRLELDSVRSNLVSWFPIGPTHGPECRIPAPINQSPRSMIPYRMFSKLYGRLKDQESLKSILDDLQGDLKKLASNVNAEDRRLLDEQTTFVREMELELKTPSALEMAHAMPELEPGVKEQPENMPRLSKMQIDLMVNSFQSDFARVATLQYTNSVGDVKMRFLDISQGHHELSHNPDDDQASQEKLHSNQ